MGSVYLAVTGSFCYVLQLTCRDVPASINQSNDGSILGNDERTGICQDLFHGCRVFECLWEWDLANEQVQIRGVTGFNSHDAASGSQQTGIGDRGASAVVSTNTCVLERRGSLQERTPVGVAKVVGRLGNWCSTKVGDNLRQRIDMSALMVPDGRQVCADVFIEWAYAEVELANAIPVKCVLEVLERQGIVENLDVIREGRRLRCRILRHNAGFPQQWAAEDRRGDHSANGQLTPAGQQVTPGGEPLALGENIREQFFVHRLHGSFSLIT